jgi:hypothetical protein
MRKRLYYLVPDVTQSRKLFRSLLLAQIEARHIHVLAKPGVDLGEMPEAGLNQRTDVLHGAFRGILFGGVTGAAIGSLLYFNPPITMALPLAIISMLALLGAIFGAWAASLIGLDLFNTQLLRFRSDIDKGKVLMMVDVPHDQVDRVAALIHKGGQGAAARGVEPEIPAFP